MDMSLTCMSLLVLGLYISLVNNDGTIGGALLDISFGGSVKVG